MILPKKTMKMHTICRNNNTQAKLLFGLGYCGALNGSHTVDAFYNKLFNLYNNSTKVHLDTIKGYANTVVNNL